MGVSTKQIEFLARAIVNRLEDRGLVEFSDAEAGINVVIQALTENFRAADAICTEARERLVKMTPGREPTDDELQHEMRRIAVDRSFII